MQIYITSKVTFETLKAILENHPDYSFILQNIALYTHKAYKEVIILTNGSSAAEAINNIDIWPQILLPSDQLYELLITDKLKCEFGDDSLLHTLKNTISKP